MTGCRRWFALAVLLIGMTAAQCRARPAGFAGDPMSCLASGVVSAPLVVGSLTLQVISRPESLSLGVPDQLQAWVGSDTRLVCGRLTPRELVVVNNGSWSVTSLDPPGAGVIDSLRQSVRALAVACTSAGSRSAEAGVSDDQADLGEALAALSGLARSEASAAVEERVGPLSKRRLAGWALTGFVLALLVLSLWASGLVWRSALALAARPWASLAIGLGSGLAAFLVMALFVRSRVGIPFLLLPIMVSAPLAFILPTVAAGALVVRLFHPLTLLGGLAGLAIVLPVLILLPILAGPPGVLLLGTAIFWAFGGVLLSRIPGTGHPYDTKEAPHDQEHLDPAAGRPLADAGSVRSGIDGELRPAVDAGQPRIDPVPEPRCEHGPGSPGHGG